VKLIYKMMPGAAKLKLWDGTLRQQHPRFVAEVVGRRRGGAGDVLSTWERRLLPQHALVAISDFLFSSPVPSFCAPPPLILYTSPLSFCACLANMNVDAIYRTLAPCDRSTVESIVVALCHEVQKWRDFDMSALVKIVGTLQVDWKQRQQRSEGANRGAFKVVTGIGMAHDLNLDDAAGYEVRCP
jgi:hypothetical protein